MACFFVRPEKPVSSSRPNDLPSASCRDAVKAGRCAAGSACAGASRPRLDGVEHEATLAWIGAMISWGQGNPIRRGTGVGKFARSTAAWWARRDREFAHRATPRSRAFAHPTQLRRELTHDLVQRVLALESDPGPLGELKIAVVQYGIVGETAEGAEHTG